MSAMRFLLDPTVLPESETISIKQAVEPSKKDKRSDVEGVSFVLS